MTNPRILDNAIFVADVSKSVCKKSVHSISYNRSTLYFWYNWQMSHIKVNISFKLLFWSSLKMNTRKDVVGIWVTLSMSSVMIFYVFKDSFIRHELVFNVWISNKYTLSEKGKYYRYSEYCCVLTLFSYKNVCCYAPDQTLI